MILIADSGSTKADWILLDGENKKELKTKGYNPYFWKPESITKEVKPYFEAELDTKKIKEVHYYGAGCSSEKYNQVIVDALLPVFPKAKISVHHDLLGAARATCFGSPGVSAILGTGSNSCLYDGTDVVDTLPNLAFIAGDEGSGSHIGKALLRAYFYREMPEEVKNRFEQMYPHEKAWFNQKIYNEPNPNVFLASFTKFCSTSKDQFFIQKLVYNCFKEFIERNIMKYKFAFGPKVHFVGSIAYYFSDLLEVALNRKGLELGIVIKQPIHNLVKFHSEIIHTEK